MEIISGRLAYQNLKNAIMSRDYRIPNKNEPAAQSGMLFPSLKPRFVISRDEKIFTIGSCFVREIESRLINEGFEVPITKFSLPQGEYAFAPPNLLNEYNLGTMYQRIESIYGKFKYSENAGIEETCDGFYDLFLHINQKPVAYKRILQRRSDILNIYELIKNCGTILITLGLTEAWHDNNFVCYLNRAPSKTLISKNPDRFSLHRMGVSDVFIKLSKMIDLINGHSKKKILLTVSPIPLEATFTGENALMANSYSKSTLRVAAQMVMEKFENVDYYPSYEMAMSGGIGVFKEDNIHLLESSVDGIMDSFFSNYLSEKVGNNNTLEATVLPKKAIMTLKDDVNGVTLAPGQKFSIGGLTFTAHQNGQSVSARNLAKVFENLKIGDTGSSFGVGLGVFSGTLLQLEFGSVAQQGEGVYVLDLTYIGDGMDLNYVDNEVANRLTVDAK